MSIMPWQEGFGFGYGTGIQWGGYDNPPRTTQPMPAPGGGSSVQPISGTDPNAIFHDAQKGIQDTLHDLNVMVDETRAIAEKSYRDAQASLDSAMTEIMRERDDKLDIDAMVGEYKSSIDQAVSSMALSAERHAEYQQLGLQAAMARGQLGANVFAVARESSRMTGQVMAQVVGQIGEIQAQAATQVGQFRIAGEQIAVQERAAQINALASLAGAQAQTSMQYAGIVAGITRDAGSFVSHMASLSANLAMAHVGAVMDQRKINASLSAASMQSQTQMNIARMQADTQLTLQQREQDFTESQQDWATGYLSELMNQTQTTGQQPQQQPAINFPAGLA